MTWDVKQQKQTNNIYNYVHTDCLRPSGGASIFVKSSLPQRKIDLQTELQATAVSVTLDREITICSVYIPPSFSLNSQHLDNLLQQLPSPYLPGRVAQSVTCLATDACLTADPGVASSIPARSHTFLEIDHEIISTVILLPSADSFKKGCCQLQAKVCAQITG